MVLALPVPVNFDEKLLHFIELQLSIHDSFISLSFLEILNTLEIFKDKTATKKIFLRHISVNRRVERASTFTIERRCFEYDREP